MDIVDPGCFFENREGQLFHVGFLKAKDVWFPLCLVSDPETKTSLDTLFLSPSLQAMTEVVEAYKKEVPSVEQTFVHYLMIPEIQNLLQQYSLEHLALVGVEEDGCGCGCGCGCS